MHSMRLGNALYNVMCMGLLPTDFLTKLNMLTAEVLIKFILRYSRYKQVYPEVNVPCRKLDNILCTPHVGLIDFNKIDKQ